jgi:tetratricopeptide (TPR) repeat protein
LEKGLAQMVITDLSQVNALRLVERLKLEQLIQELNLTQSALFEPTTVPRLGRLLGARRLVKGGFVSNNEGEIQIVTAIIESSTGEMVTKEIQVRGGIHNFFNLEKQLIFNIVQALELRLSLAEMEAIRKVPTKNFLAFLAFGEGLDFEDQGRWQEAQKSFQKAVSLDPNFVEAQSRLNLLQQPALTNIELTQKVMDLAWRTAETRLMTTTQNIIKGTLPITAEDPSVARPKGTAIVQVQGTLPPANSGDGRH